LTDLDKVTADVLGKMMMARDEETGQTMTDEELRDHVMTLMLAGHEVVARENDCI
jgi:cytochrome P450